MSSQCSQSIAEFIWYPVTFLDAAGDNTGVIFAVLVTLISCGTVRRSESIAPSESGANAGLPLP